MKKVVELFKKQKLLIIIGIFILLGIVLSVSYALWSITKTQTNDNLVTAGCFDVDFVEVTDAITLSNALPITDEEGLQTSPYTFTLTNTCSIAATYQINVEVLPVDNGQNKLADEHVKIDIDNLTSILSTNVEVESTITEASKSYTIKTGILDSGDSETFNYRQWLNYETTTAEGSNKQFKTKITITAFASLGTQYLAGEPLSYPSATSFFWGGPIGRNTVEEISFTTTNEVPAGVTGSWDAGAEKSGEVMAWYTDTDNNNMYELVVGANDGVYASENSTRLFYRFENLNSLNLANFDTSKVTNMRSMFYNTGSNNSAFTLNLGDNFDTSNVTDMQSMFSGTGNSSTVFTLNLGDSFDTSNVTNMRSMFYDTGYSSTTFTLDLGDKFDTSNVINMSSMFSSMYINTLDFGSLFDTSNVTDMSSMFYGTAFPLDLGDKFDTSNVTNMSSMFESTGNWDTPYILDLGNNFDTGKVTNMSNMFRYSNLSNLDLGDNFDTSSVINMSSMFYSTGKDSFTLNLGANFDTSKVTDMSSMFSGTGGSSFSLDLGDKFDTSNVTNMSSMFKNTANLFESNNGNFNFTLDLGSNFDTSKVTDMSEMFYGTGNNSPSFTLDLGNNFNTGNVTNMKSMFYYTGYNSINFTLNLGNNFNTSKVINMSEMFEFIGYNSSNFTLSLGNNFDTNKVTNMSGMFSSIGCNGTAFTLDLGDKFDTSSVTDMSGMFSKGFDACFMGGFANLDLGNNFDTSNVTNMSWMFSNISISVLDLGDKFDTSKVTDMYYMFYYTGPGYSSFTLDLRNFNFSSMSAGSENMIFGDDYSNNSHTVYASNSNIDFISDQGFAGTIINCTTTPASCP